MHITETRGRERERERERERGEKRETGKLIELYRQSLVHRVTALVVVQDACP